MVGDYDPSASERPPALGRLAPELEAFAQGPCCRVEQQGPIDPTRQGDTYKSRFLGHSRCIASGVFTHICHV